MDTYSDLVKQMVVEKLAQRVAQEKAKPHEVEKEYELTTDDERYYAPNKKDEGARKFIKKHKYKIAQEPNGSDYDEAFKAKSIKHGHPPHGYDKGEDSAVYESRDALLYKLHSTIVEAAGVSSFGNDSQDPNMSETDQSFMDQTAPEEPQDETNPMKYAHLEADQILQIIEDVLVNEEPRTLYLTDDTEIEITPEIANAVLALASSVTEDNTIDFINFMLENQDNFFNAVSFAAQTFLDDSAFDDVLNEGDDKEDEEDEKDEEDDGEADDRDDDEDDEDNENEENDEDEESEENNKDNKKSKAKQK